MFASTSVKTAPLHPSDDDLDIVNYLSSPAKFLRHYLRNWRTQFAILCTLVILAASCAVLVQYVMKLLVDAMTTQHALEPVWHALASFIMLIALESMLWRTCGWMTCRTTVGVGIEMRLDLFHYLSGQSIRYFIENLAGSLGQRVTATAGNFGALTNTIVWRIAPPLIDFLGALVIFVTIDGYMAAVLGVYVVIVIYGLIWFGKRGQPLHARYSGKAGDVAGDLVDVIANMWAVKAFSAREREWARLQHRFGEEGAAQRASWQYLEKTRIAYDVVLWMMAAGMLSWAAYRWSLRLVTTGDVVVISALTFRVLHGSRDLALSLIDATQQFGYIAETLRIIGQVHSISDAPDAKHIRCRHGSIEFRNVTFGYNSDCPILKNIDLVIPAGQKIGIVGPSGAGKSTFVHLLQRLYDVTDGQILIDGQAIDTIKQDSLRAALAVVPQEITLFHRSVLENIRVGNPDASDEEVYAAANASHCERFIERLADGYHTIVGERGVKLSGGQRQRVGIARAFLKPAPIIILDEATSALDTESELIVQQNLSQLAGARTVIAVAHRLSTLANFDRILVFAHGRIVEDGRAAELRARNGLFAKMWRLQSEGLSLDVAEDPDLASFAAEMRAGDTAAVRAG